MGRDKAHLEWQGQTWSTRTAMLLDRLFDEILLVGGTPAVDAPGRRVADPPGPACALRGMAGALGAAVSERVLIVATDLPLLRADLLLALTAWPESDAVVPVDENGEQPLCGIYRREVCLAAALERLETNRLSVRGWLENVETQRVPLSDLGFAANESMLLANVNTPDEFAQLGGR